MELSVETRERIAKKAYERFVVRGKKEGFAMEDWILAEKEVLGFGFQVSGPEEKPKAKERFSARQTVRNGVEGVKVTSYA